MYTWLAIDAPADRTRDHVQIQAEDTAMHMAMSHPHVEMVVGARIIDWVD
jgi:hypothetical protein